MLQSLRRALLRTYLRFHEDYHHMIVYWLARDDFGGAHPKNHFLLRADFFRERVSTEDVVIDLACGSGAILNRVADKISSGIGVDVDEKGLAFARRMKRSNVEFIQESIHGPAIQRLIHDRGITTAFLSHILEHIEHPVELLMALKVRRLLICVPSQENWYKQFLKSLGLRYLSDTTHFREYTRAMLTEELHLAGYRICEIGFNGEGEIICEATLP